MRWNLSGFILDSNFSTYTAFIVGRSFYLFTRNYRRIVSEYTFYRKFKRMAHASINTMPEFC